MSETEKVKAMTWEELEVRRMELAAMDIEGRAKAMESEQEDRKARLELEKAHVAAYQGELENVARHRKVIEGDINRRLALSEREVGAMERIASALELLKTKATCTT